ncbi:Ascorbate-specific PTS system EIIC component [Raoultella terrigena]|uniref:Ascorbate-specific PTS system EIIC component n=1 Tax=Raoultella terrigena TaxID=577 RepID=A0A3P8KHI6_RAOTE|nr:Ascorbate-specific PTS system EIIC component [Raoultella terrigena]
MLSGTFKTIVGFLVFAGGAGLAVTSLGNFQTLFSDGFGLKGVMPLAEALTGLAQTKFAMCVSLIMVIGFGWNLFFARVTPFKYIFLTGQHNLYLSALLTVTLKALGYSDMTTIIVGSVLLGLAACLYPAIAQPWMRKITGNDEIAMGHYVTLAYAASGWIGSKVGDPKQSTEKLNLPGWLGIFKDYIVSVSISVSIFYYIAALAAGKRGRNGGGRRDALAGLPAVPVADVHRFAVHHYYRRTPAALRNRPRVPRYFGEIHS